MIHGLLATVESRFAPYTRDLVHQYLLHAAKTKDASDEQGARMACGLLSDLANFCPTNIYK